MCSKAKWARSSRTDAWSASSRSSASSTNDQSQSSPLPEVSPLPLPLTQLLPPPVTPARFDHDPRWSESGDRYIIKLFRDMVFHQVDESNLPVLDLSHVLTCLNKVRLLSQCTRTAAQPTESD